MVLSKTIIEEHSPQEKNEPYVVEYSPGGCVTFTVNNNFHGKATVDEGVMLSKHKDTAVVVFGVALGNTQGASKLDVRKHK